VGDVGAVIAFQLGIGNCGGDKGDKGAGG